MNNNLLLILFALCLFARCTVGPLAGGSTDTELGSVVAGSINDVQGKPLTNAPVVIIPQGYDPVRDPQLPDSLRDTTDFAGRYRIPHVELGTYNILATDYLSIDKVLITGVPVATDDTTHILPRMVVKPGYLRIIVPVSLGQKGSYVYLPGTPFFAPVENGAAVFTGVPAGLLPSANLATTVNVSPPVVIKTDLSIVSGDTATITYYYAAWKYNKKLALNTTVTGADVTSTATDFPILVRLSDANFDFSQADNSGKDLRFSKSDGTPLPFEIERWDVVSRVAEIWVRVDTIFGNDSTQSIIMYYGNSSAANTSNGPAVFTGKPGFTGVWHLGETLSANAADATGNGYYGVPSPSAPVSTKGPAGIAKQFDGNGQYFTMPNTANSELNFPENGVYCISAWVSVDTTLPVRQGIVSKGNTQYTLEIQDRDYWAFTDFKNLVGWETARTAQNKLYTFVRSHVWTLVTAVRSGDRQYLYIDDGICTDTTNKIIASVKSRLTSFDLSIGRIEGTGAEGPCYFGGEIDEVRISSVAPTRDWIRLCFMNQKSKDELITFQ